MPSSYNLGEHFEKMMDTLIASGRYANKSEILRDGLRLIEERDHSKEAALEELRALIREGIESGPGLDGPTVMARLKAKYTAMADQE